MVKGKLLGVIVVVVVVVAAVVVVVVEGGGGWYHDVVGLNQVGDCCFDDVSWELGERDR
jgi:hypothetical protein